MIGQYWDAAIHGVGNSLTPPRDRVGNSLLDASATMATTDLVGPAIGFVAFASGHFMRRWMETRVVLHRRRERSDAPGAYL